MWAYIHEDIDNDDLDVYRLIFEFIIAWFRYLIVIWNYMLFSCQCFNLVYLEWNFVIYLFSESNQYLLYVLFPYIPHLKNRVEYLLHLIFIYNSWTQFQYLLFSLICIWKCFCVGLIYVLFLEINFVLVVFVVIGMLNIVYCKCLNSILKIVIIWRVFTYSRIYFLFFQIPLWLCLYQR